METTSALFDLASVSLACRDQATLLKTFAARVGPTLGARGVLVWIAAPADEGLVCRTRWTEPGERFDPAGEVPGEGLLAEVYQSLSESGATRRVAAREIVPDDLSHLEEASRTRVKCALYASLPGSQGPEGIVEVLNKRAGEFTAQDAHFLLHAGVKHR